MTLLATEQNSIFYARAFEQYLADMEWLTLTLEDHFNGMLGEAAVKVTGLGETAPFSGSVIFVQAGTPAPTTALLAAWSFMQSCTLSRQSANLPGPHITRPVGPPYKV